MPWNKESLLNSLQSLLGPKRGAAAPGQPSTAAHPAPAASQAAQTQRADAIRAAMLAPLEQAELVAYAHLHRRVADARDIEALWFLRADLMAALREVQGDAAAERQMALITPLFRGTLPAGLRPRTSPLGKD